MIDIFVMVFLWFWFIILLAFIGVRTINYLIDKKENDSGR